MKKRLCIINTGKQRCLPWAESRYLWMHRLSLRSGRCEKKSSRERLVLVNGLMSVRFFTEIRVVPRKFYALVPYDLGMGVFLFPVILQKIFQNIMI